MKDLSMQFLNLTNFFPLSHLKVKLLMKTGEQRIMIKVVHECASQKTSIRRLQYQESRPDL